MLHAYADDELDLARSLEIETHLEGCAACVRELAGIHALCTAFNDEALYHRAPARLAGRPSLGDAARVLLDRGVGEVVVHEGRRGASLFTEAGKVSSRGFRVEAVNPTGCGDVFNAAYVRASLAGVAPGQRLLYANAAAAWHLENVTRPYPRPLDLAGRFRVSLRPV